MKAEAIKSMVGSAILVALGVVAIYSGVRSLALLLPAAILIYYESSASFRRSKVRPLGKAGRTGQRD